MRGTLSLAVAALAALPVAAQPSLGLVSPSSGNSLVVPTTDWSQTPYENNPPTFPGNDDWTLTNAPVEFSVTAPAGLTLGACDLTIGWDSGAFSQPTFVANNAVFAYDASFQPTGEDRVRVSLARLGDNTTTGSDATLGTLRLTLASSGHQGVWIETADCRAFDGTGGQTEVSVATGDTARVAAFSGDFVARTGPSTVDPTRGDGEVDFEDLQALTAAYGASSDPSHPLHTLYRLKFDLASRGGVGGPDGIIDFEDLQALSLVYGLSALTP